MEIVMTTISKLAIAVALAAAAVASPAFAQSFNPGDGGMNSLPLQYQADGGRSRWTAPQPAAQPTAQVAERNSTGAQVAARANKTTVKIAGHHVARHGA
jgi:hypothetical protein